MSSLAFLLVRTLEIVDFLEVLRKEAGRNVRDSRFFAFGSSRSTVAQNTAVIPLAPLRSIESVTLFYDLSPKVIKNERE